MKPWRPFTDITGGSNERKEYDDAISFELHILGWFHRRSHGSTLTVAVDGATFENVRALREQYLTHLRTTTFKYAEPSFQYDGVDINTAIRSKPSEHDCSAFGVVMILDFEGAQEIKPDIQTLYQVSMVAKQLQDIQSLIQYYQTYSDTHDEINKLYALEARAKNLLGSIQRTAQIQVYALLAI